MNMRKLLVALALVWGLILPLVLLTTNPTQADSIIIYVNADAALGGDGTSWGNSYKYLQDALDEANSNGTDNYEIWVMEGVYYPDEDSDGDHASDAVTETFRLNYNNVQIYGGFQGGETAREQRDWKANLTVLSGDIDNNDMTNAQGVVLLYTNIIGNNAHHVLWLDGVTNEPITDTMVIDGFTITAGQTDGCGGGLYCDGSGNGNECSPTIANVIFSGNSAEGGGGMCNDGYQFGLSSPVLTDVTFSGNHANTGGGMVNDGYFGNSSPMLTNVIFSGNHADYGGGVYNQGYNGISSPILTNVVFKGNYAGEDGGGMYSFGYDGSSLRGPGPPNGGNSSPILLNVTFSGNHATDSGGGISNFGNTTLSNCILWGNTASRGDQIYNDTRITVGHSLVEGGCPPDTTCDSNLLTSDPQFRIPISATEAPTSAGNYRLQASSSAIDMGNSLSVTVSFDLDGNSRIMGRAVDMGAYELGPNLSTSYKHVSLSHIETGERITYTLVLRNHSNISASATLTDCYPINTTYIPGSAVTSIGSLTSTSEILLWQGNIISGTPVFLDFSMYVTNTLPIGTDITNTAHLADGIGDVYTLTARTRYNPGYRFTINEGAIFTNRDIVTLTYEYDTYVGITSVKFSNDGGFGQSTEWLPVNPVTPTYINWPLETYGKLVIPRTVYVLFRDGDGRQYGSFSDEIIYDPNPPQVNSVEIIAQTAQRLDKARGKNTIVRVTASDDNSGVNKVQISHDMNFGQFLEFAFTGNTTDISWPLQPSGIVYVRVKDRAGNLSQVSSKQGTPYFEIYLPVVLKNYDG